MNQTEILARYFSKELSKVLSCAEMKAIVKENAKRDNENPDHDTCASHDYVDANEYMIIACNKLDIDWQRLDIVNESWTLAQKNNFYLHEDFTKVKV